VYFIAFKGQIAAGGDNEKLHINPRVQGINTTSGEFNVCNLNKNQVNEKIMRGYNNLFSNHLNGKYI